jgi:hypothetical protein
MGVLVILENIVFWLTLVAIAFLQKRSPTWLYVLLVIMLIYMLIRLVMSEEGLTRAITIYSINLVIVLVLLYYANNNWM